MNKSMNKINKCIIEGRLTKDPELEYVSFKNGEEHPVVKFSIANNRMVAGNEKTTYIDVKAWDKKAEQCDEYLSKGRLVVVEGTLQMDSWEADDGTRRSRTYIVATEVLFADKPASTGAGAEEDSDYATESEYASSNKSYSPRRDRTVEKERSAGSDRKFAPRKPRRAKY